VIEDAQGQIVRAGGAFLGVATNNIAEYRALILGLRSASGMGIRRLRVSLDSELVVKQMSGEYRVKNENLRPLHEEARALRGTFEECVIGHVRRDANAAADALANQAMDRQADVGDITGPAAG
jgi:ribonuclease HI